MKILFIAPYPQGKAPSQRFRFEQYLSHLENRQVAYDLVPFWTDKGWEILYRKGRYLSKLYHLSAGFLRRFLLMFRAGRYDRILIHREASPVGPPIFEWIITKFLNKNFTYDFDDAIWMDNTSRQNRLAARVKYHHKVEAICRWASLVSCGNQWLADYALQFNKRVLVLPTTIDTDYHKPTDRMETRQRVTIGWTGTHSTARYLATLKPVLAQLHNLYDIEFLMISNQPPEDPDDFWRFEPWKKEIEIQQLQAMDIGIMPLENSNWEKGKCGFKALQYMAVGIPAVVSPVGVNNEIIEHGISGYLCSDEGAWVECLSALILDPQSRKTIGHQGRLRVEQLYSNRANRTIFYQTLEISKSDVENGDR